MATTEGKKISEMSLEELKASAYDLIAMSQRISNQLDIVNQEIAKRVEEKPTEEKITKKK